MDTARQCRVEAAQPFVFAAGAGLVTLDAVQDRVLDSRVVADVEVQEALLAEASPVAAVHHVRLGQIDRARDQLASRVRADENHVALERPADQIEKIRREIAPAPVKLFDRRAIDLVHLGEHLVGNFLARRHADADALIVQRGALVTDRRAPLVLEAVEIIVEGREAGVMPMVLVAEPLHESDRRERAGLVGLAEVDVHRRELVVLANRGEREAEQIDQTAAISARCGKKSASRMRRERHADHNLRKVAEPGALGGVGPSVIEDELAHAVGLQVERAGGDDLFSPDPGERSDDTAPIRCRARPSPIAPSRAASPIRRTASRRARAGRPTRRAKFCRYPRRLRRRVVARSHSLHGTIKISDLSQRNRFIPMLTRHRRICYYI